MDIQINVLYDMFITYRVFNHKNIPFQNQYLLTNSLSFKRLQNIKT
jgi:hypothetical protein